MARELVAMVWCDICLRDDDVKQPAEFDSVVEVSGLRRLLTLCVKHLGTVTLTELRRVLDEYGDRELEPGTAAANANAARFTCPECGKTYATSSSRAAHVYSVHGARIGDLRRSRRVEPEQPCPVPGCEFVAKTGGGLAGHLSAHRSRGEWT